jgi:guanylate kinase
MSQFLLILGPSGVGKSTVINRLCAMDGRFAYIKPYITRPLRPGETNKAYVTDEQLDQLVSRGHILVVNDIFGYKYATPTEPILAALAKKQFPILDWLIDYLAPLEQALGDSLFRVYLVPPDGQTLRRHLDDNRGDREKRFDSAQDELRRWRAGRFQSQIDFQIINTEGRLDQVAVEIYREFLKHV